VRGMGGGEEREEGKRERGKGGRKERRETMRREGARKRKCVNHDKTSKQVGFPLDALRPAVPFLRFLIQLNLPQNWRPCHFLLFFISQTYIPLGLVSDLHGHPMAPQCRSSCPRFPFIRQLFAISVFRETMFLT
jgi:hypothetical protein